MARATQKKRRRANSAKRHRPTRPRSYTPISDALQQPGSFADTELAEGMSRHALSGLLAQAISRKRRRDGEPLSNVLCALLVWPLLTLKSIHCFCAELGQILKGHASVLYDFLGREDICWRGLTSQVARRVLQDNEIGPPKQRAFVARGFAFVEMEDASAADDAMRALDGSDFGGRNLRVNEAQDKRGGGGFGGGGGGRGRY